MKSPFVSVLMPVYNGSTFLEESLASILNQTYKNFEFIIIDDGSTDGTYQILKRYTKTDQRIKIISHKKNRGIVFSLNQGLELAKGKYILRMDADDIAYPNRFVEQINFMETHPGYGVCGTWIKVINDNPYIWMPPTSSDDIKTSLFFESVIAHPSACIRTKALKSLKYEQEYTYVEDYRLWINIATKWELANLPIPLLGYRSHPNQTSNVQSQLQNKNLLKLKTTLLKTLCPQVQKGDFDLHARAMGWPVVTSVSDLYVLRDWYQALLQQNQVSNLYPLSKFSYKIAEKWVGICHLAKKLGWRRYLYILTIPSLILPGIQIVLGMKFYSIKQYTTATIRRVI